MRMSYAGLYRTGTTLRSNKGRTKGSSVTLPQARFAVIERSALSEVSLRARTDKGPHNRRHHNQNPHRTRDHKRTDDRTATHARTPATTAMTCTVQSASKPCKATETNKGPAKIDS